jgi:hypothetical protein
MTGHHSHSPAWIVWDILGEFIDPPLPLALIVLAIIVLWRLWRDDPRREVVR